MNIEELTIGQAREIASLLGAGVAAQSHPYKIGEAVLIRTVTNYLTGRIVAVHDGELVLEGAAWVASTGRFADALRTGELSEVEPFPDGPVIVSRDGIIDVCQWRHGLPRKQK